MNGELKLGAMNGHFEDFLFPLGKQCSCLCWKEVVTLSRVVTILSMKIERLTKIIDEMKMSRQRSNAEADLEEEEEAKTEYHPHQSQVIPKNEIENSHTLEDQQEESPFDINKMCVTSVTTPTDTEEEGTLSESSFIPSQPVPSSSSSSSYLKIGTSSLHIVNPSSQLENFGGAGGYDFIREDSDSENNETTADGMEQSSHTVFQNMTKKRKMDFKNTSVSISNTSAENPIVCQLCPNQPVFKTESNLKYHNRHFHTDVPEEFPCKVCGRKFPYRGGLTYHMKSVHVGRRFQCNATVVEVITQLKVN